MKTPVVTHRARFAACIAIVAALPQCAATPTPPPVVAPVAAPVVVAVEAPPDLSAVPAPAALLLTVRTPSPQSLARHLGERLGLAELVAGLEEQIPSMLDDDTGLARALDLDAPADAVVYLDARDRARAVFSLGALSMPRAEDALAQSHRLTPVSNGVRRIERTEETEGTAGPACVLAPVGGGDARAARIVCAERYDFIADALPYLTRTLPRSPLAADAGELAVDLAAEQLRTHFAEDAQRAANRLPEALTPAADPSNPELQNQIRTYLRDQVARTLTQGLADLDGARLSLRFVDGTTRLHGDLGFRGLNAPLAERLFATVHDAHPSVEVLNRLAPGAGSYVASAGSIASLRPELDLVGPVVARLLVPNLPLPPADATALRAALAGFFRAPGYNRFQSAVSSGHAQDNTQWTVATYALDAPATPTVASFRALVTALKRPAVARAVRTEWHIDPATVRTPPTTGLPAGSLMVVMPVPATVERSVREALQVNNQFEMLLVPDGNNLWMAYGANVLARYREARAPHAAPMAIPGLTADGVVLGGATLPMALARLVSRIDPQMGRAVARGFQTAPNGNAPLTGFVTARANGAGAAIAGDLVIPDTVLGAVGAMFRQTP